LDLNSEFFREFVERGIEGIFFWSDLAPGELPFAR
jgi:hypothetical protein